MNLPKYFKSILWFADFNNISLEKDKNVILFQTLEKGRMEHLRFLAKMLGAKTIYNFAKKNSKRFSRKSIVPFAKTLFDKPSPVPHPIDK
ncbi:hypothetical protein A2246_00365 [candidate division WOR-1 bacterium RIFOXYA2_FULL_37_7]|nr:MAG: hypothetical protein A2246_00365 [candidate division WOR-1 bacterium RIFOXYA2_FULL_37_7]